MNIVEHNDSLATKALSDVERYLLRVIQRYFDLFNTENENSIEAIVVESLTRMKRDIMHERSFVFDINGKAGHIVLTASDVGAEPAFSKNTAFNKDFCLPGQFVADSICEGNDPRLSDKRDPKPHNHSRYDNFVDANSGQKLGDILEQCRFTINDANHAHLNFYSVLNKLRYTGTRAQIDLENAITLKKQLEEKLVIVDGMYNGIPVRVETALTPFEEFNKKAQEILEEASSFADNPPGWYKSAIEYTDKSLDRLKDHFNELVNELVTQQYLNDFTNDVAKKYLHEISRYTVNVDTDKYTSWIDDHSIVSEFSFPITCSSEKITRVDAFLECELKNIYLPSTSDVEYEDPKLFGIQIPLPFIEKQKDGSTVHIFCKWSDNNVNLIVQIRTPIPEDVDVNQCFNNAIIKIDEDLHYRYETDIFIKDNATARLCLIDSKMKLDYIASLLQPNSLYFINGFGYFGYESESPIPTPTVENWLSEVDDGIIQMPFKDWDTSDSEYGTLNESMYVLISSNSGLMVPRKQDFSLRAKVIYEYAPKHLDEYYNSPKLSCIIYGGEEDNNGLNA